MVWVGAMRRCVGEPGLNSNWPSMPRSLSGMWLCPNTTTRAPGKPSVQARRPSGTGTAVVDHRDLDPVEVDHTAVRQHSGQPVVVVAEHGVHRREPTELVEQVLGKHVARVEDHVSVTERVVHGGGQPARPGTGPHVRVRQDDGPHQNVVVPTAGVEGGVEGDVEAEDGVDVEADGEVGGGAGGAAESTRHARRYA